MKIIFPILAISSLAVIACNHRQESNDVQFESKVIKIEGNIKNLPDGWIWLTPADRWKIHLDSAIIKDGKFIIRIDSARFREPIRVSLRYRDKSKPGEIATLNFQSDIEDGPDSSTNRMIDAFYIEKHNVKIDGVLAKYTVPRIIAGRETELLKENKILDLGWVEFPDTNTRRFKIDLFKTVIKHNPHSYFLLERLFHFKNQYSKEEFVEVLELFQKDVRRTHLGDSIEIYLSRRPDAGQPYASVDLTGPDGKVEKFPNSLQPVNMIVFWASWCTPCRREINVLKELHKKYRDAGFQMISISIDQDIRKWKLALQEERMPWKQLRVGNDQLEVLMQQYNFSEIPMTVYIDKEGREMKRFSGYDPESRINFMFLEENLR